MVALLAAVPVVALRGAPLVALLAAVPVVALRGAPLVALLAVVPVVALPGAALVALRIAVLQARLLEADPLVVLVADHHAAVRLPARLGRHANRISAIETCHW